MKTNKLELKLELVVLSFKVCPKRGIIGQIDSLFFRQKILNIEISPFFFLSRSPDSNFAIRKYTFLQYSQILNNNMLLALLVEKSFLCGAFCNITSSLVLIFTTVFKSNPKRRSSSLYLCKMEMDFYHF